MRGWIRSMLALMLCVLALQPVTAVDLPGVEAVSGQVVIERACAAAAAHRNLVLVMFTAEWCPWCRDMKKVFQEPILAEALKKFELVELDVGKRRIVDGKKRYERHFDLMMNYARKAFIPQLFVLDWKGRLVARLDPADYERANPEGNDPAKLARLLGRYRLP